MKKETKKEKKGKKKIQKGQNIEVWWAKKGSCKKDDIWKPFKLGMRKEIDGSIHNPCIKKNYLSSFIVAG